MPAKREHPVVSFEEHRHDILVNGRGVHSNPARRVTRGATRATSRKTRPQIHLPARDGRSAIRNRRQAQRLVAQPALRTKMHRETRIPNRIGRSFPQLHDSQTHMAVKSAAPPHRASHRHERWNSIFGYRLCSSNQLTSSSLRSFCDRSGDARLASRTRGEVLKRGDVKLQGFGVLRPCSLVGTSSVTAHVLRPSNRPLKRLYIKSRREAGFTLECRAECAHRLITGHLSNICHRHF